MNESTDIRPMDLTNLLITKATSAVTMITTTTGMIKRMITIRKNLPACWSCGADRKGLGYGG